jgi:2C-methyl-D-erythritol 2,4-cyclodiphosphate synthase
MYECKAIDILIIVQSPLIATYISKMRIFLMILTSTQSSIDLYIKTLLALPHVVQSLPRDVVSRAQQSSEGKGPF